MEASFISLLNVRLGGMSLQILTLSTNVTFYTFLSVVLSPEADLRPRPSMHKHNRDIEKISDQGHPVQYLNNMSHGQNLSSTSVEPAFVTQ
jgi:hypothetical protein